MDYYRSTGFKVVRKGNLMYKVRLPGTPAVLRSSAVATTVARGKVVGLSPHVTTCHLLAKLGEHKIGTVEDELLTDDHEDQLDDEVLYPNEEHHIQLPVAEPTAESPTKAVEPPAVAMASLLALRPSGAAVPVASLVNTTTTMRAAASVEGLVLSKDEAARRAVVQDKLHLLGQYEALFENNQLSWEGYVELAFPLLRDAVGMLSEMASGSSASLGPLANLEKLKGQFSVLEAAKKRGSAWQGDAAAVGKELPGPNQSMWVNPACRPKPSLMKHPGYWEGSDEDEPIRFWLTAMADWLTVNKVPKSDAVGTAANYLRGKAQTYWLAMVKSLWRANEDPTEWDVFEEKLIVAYGAHDPESVARTKIDALRQTGSVQSYMREMQMLFAKLVRQPMSEADMLFRFFAGMHPPLAARSQLDPLTAERWTHFADAAAYAVKQEGIQLVQSMRIAQQHAASRATKHTAAGGNLGAATPGFRKRFKKRKAPTRNRRQGARSSSAAAAAAAAAAGAGIGGGACEVARGSGNTGGSTRGGGWIPPSRAMKQTWFAEGKCLLCGSTQHKKAECPRYNTALGLGTCQVPQHTVEGYPTGIYGVAA